MKYMILIYGDEREMAKLSEAERNGMFEEYNRFTKELVTAKAYVGGGSLKEIATATSVRVRNGKSVMTDGPFAETKEQLGGYYIVDCESLDEAVKWAAKTPCTRLSLSSCEVRPLGIITGPDGGIAVMQ